MKPGEIALPGFGITSTLPRRDLLLPQYHSVVGIYLLHNIAMIEI